MAALLDECNGTWGHSYKTNFQVRRDGQYIFTSGEYDFYRVTMTTGRLNYYRIKKGE